jgi:hypothetical protein
MLVGSFSMVVGVCWDEVEMVAAAEVDMMGVEVLARGCFGEFGDEAREVVDRGTKELAGLDGVVARWAGPIT